MLDRYDENLILGYIENELDDADRARFEAMLAEDEPLALLIDQLIADRSMLRALPAKEAPAILMEQVQCELERQMLVDVAPHRITAASTKSSVLYRFSSRTRWVGALAAMLAIGAGLTWHFDPLGWSHTTPPVTEVAINDIASEKSGEIKDAQHRRNSSTVIKPQDGRSADSELALQAGEEQAGPKATGNQPDNRPAIASADAPPSIGSPHEAGGAGEALPVSPGGKATAALAMAQGDVLAASPAPGPLVTAPPAPTSPSPVVPAPGAPVITTTTPDAAPSGGNAIAAAKPMAGAPAPAAAPAFQIELQTENVSQTRELLLAWAHQNDATQQHDGKAPSRALSLEKATFGADSLPQATPAVPESKKRQQEHDNDAFKASEKVEAKETAEAEAGPAERDNTAAPGASKSLAEVSPAKRALRSEPNARGGAHDAGQEIPSAARSALASPGVSPPAPSSQSITLMVPEDRIDLLVEHIEAKTGQSLIVVRDGDQTLLLSPQVANRRATSGKQIEAEVAKSAEKQLESLGDAAPNAAYADRSVSDGDETAGKSANVAADKSAKPAAKSDGVFADAAAATPAAPKEKFAPASAPPAPAADSVPQENAKADEKKDSVKKDSSLQAKKAAVRQVMVKIIFAPEK